MREGGVLRASRSVQPVLDSANTDYFTLTPAEIEAIVDRSALELWIIADGNGESYRGVVTDTWLTTKTYNRLQAASGTYTVSGVYAEPLFGDIAAWSDAAAAGSYTETGTDFTPEILLPATVGTHTETGSDFIPEIALPATVSTYTETGSDATFIATYILAATVGTYAETGTNFTPEIATPAAVDTYAETGSDFTSSPALPSATGTYAETGSDVTFVATYILVATTGTYAETGSDGLTGETAPEATPGTFAETGSDFLPAISTPVDAGSYTESGSDVTFVATYILVATVGSYAETGTAFTSSPALPAAVATYAETGSNFTPEIATPAATGTYSETGGDAATTGTLSLAGGTGSYTETGSAAITKIALLAATTTLSLTIELREAGVLRASWVAQPVLDTLLTETFVLTQDEIDSIVDPADLELWITADGNGEAYQAVITDLWLTTDSVTAILPTGATYGILGTTELAAFGLLAATGTYAESGSGTNDTLLAGSASYAETGTDFTPEITTPTDTDNYAVTGGDAAFVATYILAAAAGTFAETGSDFTPAIATPAETSPASAATYLVDATEADMANGGTIPQFARPVGTFDNAGAWIGVPDNTDLWNNLDETAMDDGDYIESPPSPVAGSAITFDLTPLQVPNAGDHTLRYRYGKDTAAGDAVDLLVELLSEGSVVESWTHLDIPDGVSEADQILTGTITDYGQMQLRFTATAE